MIDEALYHSLDILIRSQFIDINYIKLCLQTYFSSLCSHVDFVLCIQHCIIKNIKVILCLVRKF